MCIRDRAYSHDGQGLHRSTDPADGEDYVYGHLFLDAAPTVFACFCLLYTSDAADERSSVDLGGRRIIKKKKKKHRSAS